VVVALRILNLDTRWR